MEISLYDKNGEAVAYISDDYKNTVYLWEGHPVAYVHDEQQVYGINGRHLGWILDEIIYTNSGERIGFTYKSCPVPSGKDPIKPKKYPRSDNQPRWQPFPLPKLTFQLSDMDFSEFLKEGEPYNPRKKSIKEEASEEND